MPELALNAVREDALVIISRRRYDSYAALQREELGRQINPLGRRLREFLLRRENLAGGAREMETFQVSEGGYPRRFLREAARFSAFVLGLGRLGRLGSGSSQKAAAAAVVIFPRFK